MQAFIKCKMNQEHYAKHCGRCEAAGQEKSIFAGIFRTPEADVEIRALKTERKKSGRSIFAGVFVDPEVHREIIESARARNSEPQSVHGRT